MDNERLQDLSIYYWLRDMFPSFVSVVDAFPAQYTQVDTPLTLPAVSIDTLNLSTYATGLGEIELNQRLWAIDVFGKNKSQRDEFTYLIVTSLKQNIAVYDYNQGFPPATVPCIGGLIVANIQTKPVFVFRELVKDLYWRSSTTFSTKYQSY